MRPLKTLKKLYDEESHVVIQEKGSPPRVMFYGEDFWVEDLPVGTRVIFPRPPLEGVPNLKAAIRYAINHPEGMDPLHALLKPGMKVTIALDDISLPLPPMKTPDVRQSVLEVVLELLADSGVDDVHLVIANALHRRLTEPEMKRMVGSKIHDEFYPDRYYNHDAEDPEGIVELERTAHNEVVAINRRAAESDLLIYVNINLVPMDGGHKSVGTGLANYDSLRSHHNTQTIRDTESYMEPSRSALHRSTERIGRVIDNSLKVFHIETTINNRMFEEPVGFLMKKEEDYTEFDRLKLQSFKYGLSKMPRAMKRKMFFNIAAPYDVTGVFAGATEPTHVKTLDMCWKQYSVPVQGQSDIVIFGMPYVSPYNVNSILNPLLVQVMALGYLFNLNRGVPLVKKGGVIIFTHPCYDEFDRDHHAPYIEFFNRCLTETRDSMKLEHKYEREFAKNPSYVHLYRKGNAYHGAHPFYMYYWGENGRQHVGVFRSGHPQVSFAAWGRHRDVVTQQHGLAMGLGETSPLARLYELDAAVLLLGVGHARNTSIHLAEYRSNWAGKTHFRNGMPVVERGAQVWKEFNDVVVDDRDFDEVGIAFEATRGGGQVKRGRVGNAEARLLNQRALVDFGVQWFEGHRG